jgi:hypothetical protein
VHRKDRGKGAIISFERKFPWFSRINLQRFFDAVVHYDLTWNPTRRKQREGCVDSFGQASKTVRALVLYGENNPVDGAVLKVILRKAKKIRIESKTASNIPCIL